MKKMKLDIPSNLENIVQCIKKAGGRSYLVGGALIDLLQGRTSKDWDIEVHKINLQELEDILSKNGKPNLVGKSFGIIKITVEGIEYDFSIPRKENRFGVGHKDFDIELVPDITPKEAAYRRDLTINSMFFDLIDMELVDPYHGLDDLNAGILRHTSEKFIEDPLRVLRIMQLLPRKGKTVAPETIELCKSLVNEYHTIPKERVLEEWNKLLMKSHKPSMGLQFLVDCAWIKYYPELDVLREIPQNPEWHPEGSVWTHTLMVLDNAAVLKEYLPDEWQRGFMYGSLLHDVGKAVTTTEELKSHGHDNAGEPIANEFMERITAEKKLIDQVLSIVKYHMMPGHLIRGNAKESGWKRLHNKIPLNVVGYISKADSTGRTGRSLEESHPPSETSLELFEKYGQEKIPPVLMGRDLLEQGYEPGPNIGQMLREAYQIQIDEGVTDKGLLLQRIQP